MLLIGDTLNIGGTEGQFVEIACRLDRSRWDVYVTCLRAEGPLRSRLEAAGVYPWSCGMRSLRPAGFAVAVWRLARYIRTHRIRLVHCFDFYSNVRGVPAARLAGISEIIASQRNLGQSRPWLQQKIHNVLLGCAHRVLVNSEAAAERLTNRRIVSSDRIALVLNGVETNRFSPRLTPRKATDRVTIGTLANLRPEKGVKDLILAASSVLKHYPETRFVVWGEGSCRSELEGLIRQLGLEETVALKGSTDAPDAALRELDIFVLPSRRESCSNALMEAMATGLPIVATHVGGNPSLVKDGITGLLVPPGDPAALGEAIIRLIQSPTVAADLAAAAQAHARAEFSIEKMVTRIESLYEHVLAGRGI